MSFLAFVIILGIPAYVFHVQSEAKERARKEARGDYDWFKELS